MYFGLVLLFESILYTNLLGILEKTIYVKLLQYDFFQLIKIFYSSLSRGKDVSSGDLLIICVIEQYKLIKSTYN